MWSPQMFWTCGRVFFFECKRFIPIHYQRETKSQLSAIENNELPSFALPSSCLKDPWINSPAAFDERKKEQQPCSVRIDSVQTESRWPSFRHSLCDVTSQSLSHICRQHFPVPALVSLLSRCHPRSHPITYNFCGQPSPNWFAGKSTVCPKN